MSGKVTNLRCPLSAPTTPRPTAHCLLGWPPVLLYFVLYSNFTLCPASSKFNILSCFSIWPYLIENINIDMSMDRFTLDFCPIPQKQTIKAVANRLQAIDTGSNVSLSWLWSQIWERTVCQVRHPGLGPSLQKKKKKKTSKIRKKIGYSFWKTVLISSKMIC